MYLLTGLGVDNKDVAACKRWPGLRYAEIVFLEAVRILIDTNLK
jgi:hypothetical protein